MRVVDLARACEVSQQAVRLYEREGILLPVARTGKGYRLYDARSLETLKFIKRAQRCGFKLTEIRALLQVKHSDPSACSAVRALLDHKIQDIVGQVHDLEEMQEVLQDLRAACDGGSSPTCPAFIQLCDPNCALPDVKARGVSS